MAIVNRLTGPVVGRTGRIDYNGGHLWLLDLDIAVGKMWRVWFRGGPYSLTLREGPFDVQSLRIKVFKRGETPHGRLGPMASGLSAWLLAFLARLQIDVMYHAGVMRL
jgi:hypothetical protein